MPRAGLTTDRIVEMAAGLTDDVGPDRLTLAAIAERFGVKTPSLYVHIDGLDGLKRAVALHGIERMGDALRTAVMGRSDRRALDALARAYRAFALEHPGVYRLTQITVPDDEQLSAASARVLEPVMAVLAGYGRTGDDAIHAARALRSALHGFVSLETNQGFGLDVSVNESFARMIDVIDQGLSNA